MNMNSTIVSLETLEATAAKFIRTLNKGDVVFMEGNLGSGKTTFVRAAIQSLLGQGEHVPSPTFTLVQTYDTQPPIWHYDLYRLEDPEEVLELGMDEAFNEGITFIEWPNKMGTVFHPPHYTIYLEMADNPNERILSIKKFDC
jgi:tRNA threonylcarbamoyladenosine biosynthesis protein TsaE